MTHSYKTRCFTHLYFDPEEEYLAEPSSAKLPPFCYKLVYIGEQTPKQQQSFYANPNMAVTIYIYPYLT